LYVINFFCPHLWKYELFLQEIEEHLEEIFSHGQREIVQRLLYKLGNRLFQITRDSLLQSDPPKVVRMIEILEMISTNLTFSENDLERLEQLSFSGWFFELKTKFWSTQLKFENSAHQKEIVYLLLEMENKRGKQFCLNFLKTCETQTPSELTKLLYSAINSDGHLSKTERSMQDVIIILEKEQNQETSNVVQILKTITQNKENFCSNEEEAKQWLGEAKKINLNTEAVKFISIFNAVVKQKMGFCLRPPQQITILALLTTDEDSQNLLAQVSTGEGKSLIVAALAIARSLSGMKVDVTTSSSLLAVRDSTLKTDKGGLLDIYQVTSQWYKFQYYDLEDQFFTDFTKSHNVLFLLSIIFHNSLEFNFNPNKSGKKQLVEA
jgi:hypothetical protein